MTAPVDVTGAVADPMDAPPLRWGILGPGRIAESFTNAVVASTRGSVVAVGSRSAARAGDFVRAHAPDARVHASYEALVADPDVDAVYVASPHSHHHDHALLGIAAGKHLLVEKAFTRNTAEARAVLDSAGAAGVFVMEAMKTRHLPHVAALRSILASGEIGDVVSVRGSYEMAFPFDAASRIFDPALAGGGLLDIGVYPLAFALDLLGAPDDVLAAGVLTPTGVDAQATVVLRYPAAVATCTSSLVASAPVAMVIAGTRGWVDLPHHYSSPATFTVHRADGSSTTYDGRVPDGKQYEAAEVARCVSAGLTESPRMSWQHTLDLMAVLDRARAGVGVRYPGE